MDLKPLHFVVIYLVGLALIAVGVGFYDWRLALVAVGAGLVGPVVTLPDRAVR